MRTLYSSRPVARHSFAFRNGPESHSEQPDPIDAVRSGVVGDLADLSADVVQEADQPSTASKAFTALAQGPIVGPARLWRKMRQDDQDQK